jgi:hypothetical protein
MDPILEMRRSYGAKFFLGLVLLLSIPGMLWGKTLQIAWSSNTEDDLSGYRLYYGTSSRDYDHVLNVGNTASVTVEGFLEGETYYFGLTAYDYSGNESGYSAEVSVSIPGTSSDGSGSSSYGIFYTFLKWVRTLFGSQQATDSPIAQYSIKDFSSMSSRSIARSLSVVRVGGVKSSTPTTIEPAGTTDYIIKDTVAMVGEYYDISLIYPDGTYIFLPLTSDTPRILNDLFVADAPGPYLYLVADALGEYLHILRVSTMDMLYAYGDYKNGSETYLEDKDLGVSVMLSSQALESDLPVAIGQNYNDISEANAQTMNGKNCLEFSIVPYGLTLSEPAEVRVEYEGSSAAVEYFDENDGVWKSIPDAKVENGQVVFSAQTLGKFRVYGDPSGSAESSGGGGGGCFITVCR